MRYRATNIMISQIINEISDGTDVDGTGETIISRAVFTSTE